MFSYSNLYKVFFRYAIPYKNEIKIECNFLSIGYVYKTMKSNAIELLDSRRNR